ncbi:bifunctional riboflavin kinase/FAD synthetase [Pseudoalteromonas luteoviolacea]|uniref:Riboflavin biosynthesis protein n=1 Tax=Pseudoalteromonas luteoviolacea S4060-1 TaxID=1365257 RepID=A0A167MU71_9GAMM|nr:bifunctional riboflavin kinase/FAD synthetase [Pseudoalteromonas luteoviolacea]KZN66951.1 bifunctional riboflavin kinase/FMN adenylyltransferase [Pseudoalteromonas luteoviolacea S4060-1]
MQLIRGIHNIRPHHYGCVLTIGNFDGVHLGHTEVLKGLKADAEKYNLPSTVMLFEPQPQEFFIKSKAPARLTRLRDKLALLADIGIDRVICVSFNNKFSNLEAEYFVREVLFQKLGVKALTVGDDFRFGKARKGDFSMLSEIGKELGMHVKDTQSFRQENSRVSSTLIRAALAQGDVDKAHEMLGHTYAISGRVIHGWKKGRELGFRTANVALKRQVSPVQGVFAVNAYIKNEVFKGVANVGTKPTLNGKRALLEVHLFDFDQNIYGQFIKVELIKKLRDEQKFESLAHLTQQITADVDAAKAVFSKI